MICKLGWCLYLRGYPKTA